MDIIENQPRLMTKNYSVKQIKKNQKFFENNQERYIDEVKKFDKKMDKIESNIQIEMNNQSKFFEELKKKKLERISSKKSNLKVY